MSFEPEFVESDGIKFESTGTLLVPAPGESEKYATRNPEMMSVVGSKPVVYAVEGGVVRTPRWRGQKVKMGMMNALKLRTKGA